MIGATITPTGTPASESSRIARNRAAGVAVRGSIVRASSASSVVTLTYTCDQILRRQRRQQVQIAHDQRVLGDDAHGLPRFEHHFQAAAREAKLALGRLIAIGHARERQISSPRQLSLGQLRAQQLGASCLTRMRVSKSSPAFMPRVSCPGRA